jgi:hypothetical protein
MCNRVQTQVASMCNRVQTQVASTCNRVQTQVASTCNRVQTQVGRPGTCSKEWLAGLHARMQAQQ